MQTPLALSTPALLFSAISLLFLAYTNRFLVLAQLIRQLHGNKHTQETRALVLRQIENLRLRIKLTKFMQALGVFSFFLCADSMYFLFHGYAWLGEKIFGASLLLLLASLAISFWEIMISTKAIELELKDLEG